MTSSSTDELLLQLHNAALSDMQTSRPKNLTRALAYQAEELAPEAAMSATEGALREALERALPTDRLVEMWRKKLTDWDFAPTPSWSDSAERTEARRGHVYDLLGLSEESRKLLDNLIPVSKVEAPVVITDEFTPWYTPESQHGRPWYWPSYRSHLEGKGWTPEAVAGLDVATDAVVERLADPTQTVTYQAKGLVVGYVQSGKTANFTGVIAKAVDAGYRLVIVLGGTLNMLRAQTQRRLDMELVGRENILRGASEYESDYASDPAWAQGKFVTFGALPSSLGAFDIVRLTTFDDDYKSLLQGITALEQEKQEPALPLFDPRNLHRSAARLMIVKKNKSVLTKLVNDLKKLKTPLAEIPVLIIDDESDEASVNTANLAKPDAERPAINGKISELLRMLPRAQYVGYTATPFANVFVDPSDAEDIFPKDFIVSLPRPQGYMGARDFHDLDSVIPDEGATVANSNELAHVRSITLDGEEADDICLQRAMDTFVLTGAMKLYREAEGGLGDRYFQHHTMLVHESVRTHEQRELLGKVSRMWWNAGYMGPSGHERLRELFETDLACVSAVRADGHAVPPSYEALAPYVGPAVTRIGGDDNPIIVVNSDKDIETGQADFDKRSIWKILIGGQKLARGFTVEGLTVSYFRRRAGNASTLMQMGRWFGFREGYRDLVRLFLGRAEKLGAKEIDLYAAFEAICLDEENFRAELKQYATMVDGKPQVTPAQVPPLVSQHLPWLKPTSPNKMYNAKLVEIHSPGQWQEPTAYPTKVADLRFNTNLWTPVLTALPESSTPLAYHFPAEGGRATVTHSFEALVGRLAPTDFLDLVRQARWEAPSQFAPNLAYLAQITADSSEIDDWLVIAPQHTKRGQRLVLGNGERTFAWFGRERRRGPLFGAISEPKHRGVPLRIAGALTDSSDPGTENLVAARRGAVIVYPVVEAEHRPDITADGRLAPEKIVMAFSFVAPATARRSDGRVLRFTTVDSAKEGKAIIDAW
ncbi:Z1 domain-containing protein [Streptomyces sp. NBC_00637]|uniref:Z1 domain-containing protein n=1 Tax=Streptomyces sp. NBC_00637 TaxID=2903667 RepID=UPI00325283AE